MKMRIWIILLLSLPCFARAEDCRVHNETEINQLFPTAETTILDLMKKTEITGLSLVVLKEGKPLYVRKYGDALIESHFQAASISKPVAAYGALKMVETKELSLESPLSQFVLKPYLPTQEFTELVNLKNILNHTSGMSNDVTGEDRKLYFKPGTQYQYSGGGFLYMQQAIEDISHQDFSHYMKRHLERLGMKESTYELVYEGVKYIGAPYSLVTTPEELGYFFDNIARPKPSDLGVVKMMTTPTWHVEGPMDFGLGVGIFHCGDEVVYRHSGRNFSLHHSLAVMSSRTHIGAVVMARGKDSRGIPQKIIKMILGSDFDIP